MRSRLRLFTSTLMVAAVLTACATKLDPKADPFVVSVEKTQTMAKSTFDMVLRVDHADRGFWRTNAPAFHDFCEWLRTPTPYQGTPLPRCTVMQLNVDDLKTVYQVSKTTGSSNALYSVWETLKAGMGQATSWYNIVTNTAHL